MIRLSQRGTLTVMIKNRAYPFVTEYVLVVLPEADTLPSPEKYQNPPPASRTLQNP